jgi:hypothetical protein
MGRDAPPLPRRFTETFAALGVTVRVFTDPRPAEEWRG